jgi:hypothetical protein
MDAKCLERETEVALKKLDGLLASTVLSCASLVPGPAGIAAATAAVGFDVSRKHWVGATLSGLSMIPLAGYIPGVLKVVWNVIFLNAQLAIIESSLPAIIKSPALLAEVQEAVGKYAGKIFDSRLTATISSKLKTIMEARADASLPDSP